MQGDGQGILLQLLKAVNRKIRYWNSLAIATYGPKRKCFSQDDVPSGTTLTQFCLGMDQNLWQLQSCHRGMTPHIPDPKSSRIKQMPWLP